MEDKLTLSTEDYELCNKLKRMRFSGMAQALEDIFSDPNADLLPFREKVNKMIDAEWNLRYTKKLNRFIKKLSLNIHMLIWMTASTTQSVSLIATSSKNLPNVIGLTKVKIWS